MKKPLKFKVNSLRTLVSPYKKGAKDESTYAVSYTHLDVYKRQS